MKYNLKKYIYKILLPLLLYKFILLLRLLNSMKLRYICCIMFTNKSNQFIWTCVFIKKNVTNHYRDNYLFWQKLEAIGLLDLWA